MRRHTSIYMKVTVYTAWGREAVRYAWLHLDRKSFAFIATPALCFILEVKVKAYMIWSGKKSLSARSLITWDSAFQVTISCSTAVTFKSSSLLLVLIVHSHSRALFRNSFSDIIDPRGQSEKWVFKLCRMLCVCVCVSKEFSWWVMSHCKSSCLVRSQLGWCLFIEGTDTPEK